MSERLGIIIPTYDNLGMLMTLVGQIYDYTENFNLYVVEDGLKIKTKKFLLNYDKENFKPILHEKNKGIAPSWNDGLKAALADDCGYFAVLNDDIELPENWWNDCRQAFNSYTHIVCLDAPSPIPITGWFFILDRKCVDKAGLFDENFAPYMSEDAEYIYRCFSKGLKMKKVKINVFHHGSTTINKVAKKDMAKFKRICGENWDRLRKKYPNFKMQA